MIEIEVNLPIKTFNLNQLTDINRGNKFGAAAKKKQSMRDIYYLIKQQLKTPLTGQYRVYAKWRVSSKRGDLDNLLLKNIFDSMQEFGLLKNDNLNHIVEINHRFEVVKKNQEGVTLRFFEVDDE